METSSLSKRCFRVVLGMQDSWGMQKQARRPRAYSSKSPQRQKEISKVKWRQVKPHKATEYMERAQQKLGVWTNSILPKLEEDPMLRHMIPIEQPVRGCTDKIPWRLLNTSLDLGIQGLGVPVILATIDLVLHRDSPLVLKLLGVVFFCSVALKGRQMQFGWIIP